MTSVDLTEDVAPRKSGKLFMVVALMIALIGGGGGFLAAFLGVLDPFIGDQHMEKEGEIVPAVQLDLKTYFPLETLIVNVRSSSKFKHLRLTAQLEVNDGHLSEIESLKPRIADAMNTFLNALDAKDFEDPIAIIRLRNHLLRRVQIVTGPSRISDLLIMEFVLQ